MRILVPLDGSPLAERALGPAIEFLHNVGDDARLYLLRVAPTPEVISGDVPIDYAVLLDDARVACEDYLREVAARPDVAAVPHEVLVTTGAIADAISATAQRNAIDFIVMTSHGRTGFVHLALGSVAEAVARDAHIPTLIIRASGTTFPTSGHAHPFTILVPLDGTPLAETALDPAATLARAFHASIHLLEVLPPEEQDDVHAHDRANQAYNYLTAIHDRLEQQGIAAHRSLAWGHPLYQIALEVERAHADIVALATHGRTGLARVLHGSIARDVFHDIDRPVLILHPAADASPADSALPTATTPSA